MNCMKLVRTAFVFIMASVTLCTGLCAVSAGAHAPEAKLHGPYADTAKGLKQELKDMRDVARRGRSDRLRAMVLDLDIPDARAWYVANFGTQGLKTAEDYKKHLTASDHDFESQMIEFAREDGYFSVKKQDAKRVFPSVITTPELFLASWESTSADGEEHSDKPFGYFWFIDGKFRWDSTIAWITLD